MRKMVQPLLGLLLGAPAPGLAEGSGDYDPSCPGAEKVRMSGEERELAGAAHQTNDTNGGFSSTDKSCETWEGGGTRVGPVPATLSYGCGGARWGWGGALTGM